MSRDKKKQKKGLDGSEALAAEIDRIIKNPVVKEWEPMLGCVACLDAKRIMSNQAKIEKQIHGQTMKKLAELRAENDQIKENLEIMTDNRNLAMQQFLSEQKYRREIVTELRAEVERLRKFIWRSAATSQPTGEPHKWSAKVIKPFRPPHQASPPLRPVRRSDGTDGAAIAQKRGRHCGNDIPSGYA